ncbi:MAG: cyclic pyranopterin monophosphate synthase MoaC [Chlorobi bacterium]|nr:cyclic pyranopterin monophosphate synthase MoaC [Chlorobiota bacterium]
MAELTHLDDQGAARMVDVSEKEVTTRRATAEALVQLSPNAFAALQDGTLKKGDALAVARVAGISAAKQTSSLIPLCHPLPISAATIDFDVEPQNSVVRIRTTITIAARTGVEMEALTAVSVAALTIYDMCKAIDKRTTITQIRLLAKSGGCSGDFNREE